MLDRLVALVARVLEDLVRRIAVQRNRDRPRPRIHVRILDRDLVGNRVRVGAREAFDQAQRAAVRDAPDACRRGVGRDPSLVVEVRRLDDQRVAVPAAPRISRPRADARVEVRSSVDGNDPRLMDHLVDNRHVSRRLHNLVGVVVAGRKHSARTARDAAIPRAHQLVRVFVGQIAIPRGLRLRLERYAPVRRIGHQRSTPGADDFRARVEPDVVIAADVARLRMAVVLFAPLGGLAFERRRFLPRQERFVGQRARPLEGRDRRVGPHALEVGCAVRRPRQSPRLRRRGGGRPRLTGDRHRRERSHHHRRRQRAARRQPSMAHVMTSWGQMVLRSLVGEPLGLVAISA